MANTRFNPNLNGTLHIGHLYTLLVNEYIAHSTGGKFYVRFDDDNYIVNAQPKEQTSLYMQSQIDDIDWLGLKVDGWSQQSTILPEVRRVISFHKELIAEEEVQFYYYVPYIVCKTTDWIAVPYVPVQTIERTVMDNMLDIDYVIRGDDFITEYSLYCYFCQKLNLKTPKFVFLPRLNGLRGDISKSHGGYKISDFRNEGYSAKELKDLVTRACVVYPHNGFELYNLKQNPRIDL